MCQLLPEVKDIFNSLSDGIKRYDTEPSGDRRYDELTDCIKRVDEEADKIKNKIIKDTPDFLKVPIKDALYLKKNNDRAFSSYVGTLLVGGNPEEYLNIFFALDVLDFSVIIIDDILDGADKRANKPAYHKKWGMETSISVAMCLKSLSSKMVMDTSLNEKTRLRLLKEFNEFHSKIYEGQFLDVNYEDKDIGEITEMDYLDMVSLTTGHQIAGCFRIGGILSYQNEDVISILGEIGMRFGMAGQIRDDLIDYMLDEEYTWKTPLLDFRRNKKRIPLIIAWKNATEKEREEIKRLQKKESFEKQDYIRILSIVMKPENLKEIKLIIEKIEDEAMDLAERVSLNQEGLELLRMLFSLVRGNG